VGREQKIGREGRVHQRGADSSVTFWGSLWSVFSLIGLKSTTSPLPALRHELLADEI
jgi:hypothetical protein